MNSYRSSFYALTLSLSSLSLIAMEPYSQDLYTSQDAQDIANFFPRRHTPEEIKSFLRYKIFKLNNSILRGSRLMAQKHVPSSSPLSTISSILTLKKSILTNLWGSIAVNGNINDTEWATNQIEYNQLSEQYSNLVEKLKQLKREPVDRAATQEMKTLISHFHNFNPVTPYPQESC